MAVEISSWSIFTKVWDRAGIQLATCTFMTNCSDWISYYALDIVWTAHTLLLIFVTDYRLCMFFCCLLFFFSKSTILKIFQKHQQTFKQFRSRSTLAFCRAWTVHLVCKGYQQMTLKGQELMCKYENVITAKILLTGPIWWWFSKDWCVKWFFYSTFICWCFYLVF